ncbi:DNA-binding transcriptional LysR family regulator [Murinocardiopsis flavida]|uniref:DNA-binding transcriptional LysR family regulator n=1 Tax=Murinocardiopsis flavida TaxID=645275 RepID=A0A2P8DKP3_9ACTN|nr:LysR family transcriptional regulator [Murinocardiopsis flavida]PSK97769.1 DNA-binding transcriptional LysR family regulator [Murinocardiopsis flavida]
MIDLRRLRVLQAVAHYGTVTAAANALHMTPSAASQQVRQLGRDLGTVLLEPHGRRVRLTPAARGLLSHAAAIESRWQQAAAELSASNGRPAGVLRLAGFPTAICTLLTPISQELEDANPNLTVQLRQAESADCFELLFNGGADLAIVEATPSGPAATDRRFDQRPLIDDPFELLVPEGHPLAARTSVRLEEAAEERWILCLPGSTSREHVLAACSPAGFSPSIAHEVQEWTVAAGMVAHRLGVALVPRLAQLPPGRPVTHLPIAADQAPSRRYLTCTRRGSRGSPAIAAAVDALHARAAILEAELKTPAR